jgi:hypothetical protein
MLLVKLSPGHSSGLRLNVVLPVLQTLASMPGEPSGEVSFRRVLETSVSLPP